MAAVLWQLLSGSCSVAAVFCICSVAAVLWQLFGGSCSVAAVQSQVFRGSCAEAALLWQQLNVYEVSNEDYRIKRNNK